MRSGFEITRVLVFFSALSISYPCLSCKHAKETTPADPSVDAANLVPTSPTSRFRGLGFEFEAMPNRARRIQDGACHLAVGMTTPEVFRISGYPDRITNNVPKEPWVSGNGERMFTYLLATHSSDTNYIPNIHDRV